MHDVKDASLVRTILGREEWGIGEWYQHCEMRLVEDEMEGRIGVVDVFLHGLDS